MLLEPLNEVNNTGLLVDDISFHFLEKSLVAKSFFEKLNFHGCHQGFQ